MEYRLFHYSILIAKKKNNNIVILLPEKDGDTSERDALIIFFANASNWKC